LNADISKQREQFFNNLESSQKDTKSKDEKLEGLQIENIKLTQNIAVIEEKMAEMSSVIKFTNKERENLENKLLTSNKQLKDSQLSNHDLSNQFENTNARLNDKIKIENNLQTKLKQNNDQIKELDK